MRKVTCRSCGRLACTPGRIQICPRCITVDRDIIRTRMVPNYKMWETLKMVALALIVGLSVASALLQFDDNSSDSLVRARMIAAETP
jgi:hypothetical protein